MNTNTFLIVVFWATTALPCFVWAAEPRLIIQPERPLLDDVLDIQLTGLPPDSLINIRAQSTDDSNQEFQSFASFRSDASGAIKLARQAPVAGSYQGVDPMGLFWSMDVPSPQHGHVGFHLSQPHAVDTTLEIETGGITLLQANVTRHAMAENVVVREINEQGIFGRLYQPAGEGPFPAAIWLGGSEGGIRSTLMPAGLLASKGVVVLSLPYFSHEPMGDLPRELVDIPLEFFNNAVSWLGTLPFVDQKRISLVGGSKGAEAALLVAAHFENIEAVVAYSPSSVSWAAPFTRDDQSSWSLEGQPLPFVPYQRDPAYRPPRGFPNQLARHYRYSLDRVESNSATIIPVENITGRILLISGSDDLIWGSAHMARQVTARLVELGKCSAWAHLQYENAGHSLPVAILPTTWTPGTYKRWPNGGTPQGNAVAQRDAWNKLLAFLQPEKPVSTTAWCRQITLPGWIRK